MIALQIGLTILGFGVGLWIAIGLYSLCEYIASKCKTESVR